MLYRFDSIELDTAKAELRKDGAARPVEPQVLALLTLLVENRERLVSRDEILDKIWDGRVVSDAALSSRIKSARQAIGDDGQSQRFIRTIHGRGLRFVAEVKVARAVPLAEPPPVDLPAGQQAEQPTRPSIAVLPFRLVGDAGRYTAIADALPHELITELSRLRWLFVTARGSSFRLRSEDADMREIGRVLGVRYCLSGTVDVAGTALVVTVELVDTRSGGVVWADRFAGLVDDVHAIREDIRSRILTALELQIPLHEASLARLTVTGNLDAWSAYHLGLQHMYRFNRTDNAAATALFQQAVAQDPGFARAHAGLSFVHFQTAFMRHTDDIAGESDLARRFAERGLELDPLDPFVNFTMGRTFWLSGDLEGGLAWLERATAISPNYAQGIYAKAWTETLAGRGLQGRAHVDLSMRLSPLDPLYYAMLGTRAFTHMVVGEDLAAAEWAERAARSPGAHVLIAMIASATQSMIGNDVKAAHWAANVRERNPVLTRADFFRSFPMKSEVTRARLANALERCGF
ncbi:MAG: winged helix-turn-helix domain-containing protein [Gammaproteobacteria bacterium]|nr:winged helix-turn-helix domain-containing protein [Gammaproteobacteria bacterium]MDH4312177.1 winged helix-turn-helix domain-containing protein [Gammaproteobacteria bacterium]MDH5274416.1 winged helix-turn-helix domain-containing protein [Gammaproteobacteria bacterium]